MHSLAQVNQTTPFSPALRASTESPVALSSLTGEHEAEVLVFLDERPIHTFGMVGFIRNNGLVSPHNRGTFYGCRDRKGRLQGVALIGHHTLFETRSDVAIEAFARLAQKQRGLHMMMGESDKVQTFWNYYADGKRGSRLNCRELLMLLRWPIQVREAVPGLRLATMCDLDLVVPVHAELAFEESGINPLDADPAGFRLRCARRIEQGRTWLCVEEDSLLFKAEIVSQTPQSNYLEGIWVNPAKRGRGLGLRCMAQLSRQLLHNTGSVCLLVNEKNLAAQAFYKKSGFKLHSTYDTIFI